MRYYRLCPDVHVEYFDEEAILFVASREMLVTVNRAAAELYETARAALAQQPFTREECVDFLLDTYELTPAEAELESQSLLAFGLRSRIVLQGACH